MLRLEKSIEKQLDGIIFWSFGPNNARGVGVYIKNSLNINIYKFTPDPFGRYIIIDFNLFEKDFRIINIYAPNNAPERKQFFIDLYPHFLTPKTIIFWGDFNCLQNTTIDKIGGNPHYGNVGWTEIATIVKELTKTPYFQ